MARFSGSAIIWLLTVLVLRLSGGPSGSPWESHAFAQTDSSNPETEQSEVSGDPALDAGSMTAGPQFDGQLITIEVEQFGVGDVVRESDWTGLSLILSDPTADKARAVAVRIAIRDEDGDTQYPTRTLTLSQASRVRTWLYFRAPKGIQAGSVFTVSIHEMDDSAPSATDGAIVVGRQLAFRRIAVKAVLDPPTDGLIGVIGRRSMRLEQYELRGSNGPLGTGHEPSLVVSGLTAAGLPDSWFGLAPYEVLLWNEGGPEQLEESRHKAIREWVHRGGHLIVQIPPVGSTWFTPSNPLQDLMPSVKVIRQEDQPLEPYRVLLTGPDSARDALPDKTVLHSFERLPDASASEAVELIAGPNGCVVARRAAGAGMITVIGLDIGAGRLPGGQLQADHFWHRLIGRRFDIPTGDRAKQLGGGGVFGTGTIYADGYIGPEIAKSRSAGLGVLLGLVVFAAYWFVAGPGGFGLLKMKGLLRHAWVAFCVSTLLFAGVAWIGATGLRPRQVEATHLTYLTHVYGQPVQAARLWASVLLPQYGDRAVSVGRPDADKEWRQALTGWSEPIGNARPVPFPDARGYSVDTRRLQVARVPARATVRQFQADWLGGPTWSMPGPVSPDQSPQLLRRSSTLELSGRLAHQLPGGLSNVVVILVSGQTTASRESVEAATKTTGTMPSEAYAWSLSTAWEPGMELNLAELSFKDAPRFETYISNLTPAADITNIGASAPSGWDIRAPEYHTISALYSMLPQPEWDKINSGAAKRVPNIRRQASQGTDLGKWFTQPCLIIVGQIAKSATPVPLFVEGEPCPSEGRTVVRWVYPLPSAPPRF